jgi:hypothetical protein
MQPHATNEIKKEKEREEREIDEGVQVSSPPKTPGFQENEKNGCNGFTGSADADQHGFTRGSEGLHELPKASLDADNHGCISSDCGIGPHPRRDEPTPPKKIGDFSADEAALLKRICGRMRQQHPNKPINAFELAVLMRSNDRDIGIERCKEWIAREAPA